MSTSRLTNLRKNKDVVITKLDKGNRVVILDRKFYINAIEEIISDTSTGSTGSLGNDYKLPI